MSETDATDRAIILATQKGLPLVPRPFDAIGQTLGLDGAEVERRMQAMLDAGIIRRMGCIPNHYALGFKANGMSVWDVEDEAVAELGPVIGAFPFVSHCYRRPRHLPLWRYNLFAMVHGHDRADVEALVAQIARTLGARCHASDILYSTRILKKTGLRLSE